MASWSDIRDDYVKPAAAFAVNPLAGQAELASGDSGSDIPGVDMAQDLYGGITGQTAAEAAERAAALQASSANYAADLNQQMYEQTRQDQMPWMQAGEQALGTLQEMMAGGAPSMEDYEMSDYASFMQDEGLAGIEAKSRAGGYYNTGATSREMLDYSRNVAGQDYQTYLNNYYQSLNPYLAVSGSGQQMANTMGQQSMQSAATQGGLAQQAAASEAAGVIGSANATTAGAQNLLGLGLTGLGMAYGGPAGATAASGASQYSIPDAWSPNTYTQGPAQAWA